MSHKSVGRGGETKLRPPSLQPTRQHTVVVAAAAVCVLAQGGSSSRAVSGAAPVLGGVIDAFGRKTSLIVGQALDCGVRLLLAARPGVGAFFAYRLCHEMVRARHSIHACVHAGGRAALAGVCLCVARVRWAKNI